MFYHSFLEQKAKFNPSQKLEMLNETWGIYLDVHSPQVKILNQDELLTPIVQFVRGAAVIKLDLNSQEELENCIQWKILAKASYDQQKKFIGLMNIEEYFQLMKTTTIDETQFLIKEVQEKNKQYKDNASTFLTNLVNYQAQFKDD